MDHPIGPAPPSYEDYVGKKYPSANFCGQCGTAYGDQNFCTSCGAALLNVAPSIQGLSMANVQAIQGLSAILQEAVTVENDMYVCIGNRLIYDFEKLPCFLEPSGLQQEVKHNIPVQLHEKGITAEQWLEWMSELDEIQELPPSICCCLTVFCCPGLCLQSILCALICPLSANHFLSWLPCCYGDWYEALQNWMQMVNGTLTNYGMYTKLLTYKPFNHAPKSKRYNERVSGKDHNYEMSFLAIALTPEESRKLMEESWDHGVNDGCTSGIGRCL